MAHLHDEEKQEKDNQSWNSYEIEKLHQYFKSHLLSLPKRQLETPSLIIKNSILRLQSQRNQDILSKSLWVSPTDKRQHRKLE